MRTSNTENQNPFTQMASSDSESFRANLLTSLLTQQRSASLWPYTDGYAALAALGLLPVNSFNPYSPVTEYYHLLQALSRVNHIQQATALLNRPTEEPKSPVREEQVPSPFLTPLSNGGRSSADTDTPSPPPRPSTSKQRSAPQRKSTSKENKPFICPTCKKGFGYKHVLQNHERTHTGEKPFRCTECFKRFTRDHHLKTHMRLHTGERPFVCQYCAKRFVQVANLRRHELTHKGDRPYLCIVCNSNFSDVQQLQSHTCDSNILNCKTCHKHFNSKALLDTHACVSTLGRLSPLTEGSLSPESPTFERKKKRRRKSSGSIKVSRFNNRSNSPEQNEPEDLSLKPTEYRANIGVVRPAPYPTDKDYIASYLRSYMQGSVPNTQLEHPVTL